MTPKTSSNKSQRRGTATVEFALVVPVFLLVIFGGIELSRAVMVKHMLEEAARAGCRVATVQNPERQDVLDIVEAAMSRGGITDYSVTMDPDPPADAEYKTAVSVSVSIAYQDVSWLPVSRFMQDAILTGACIMPAEAEGDEFGNDPTKKSKKSKKSNTKKSDTKKTDTKKTKKTDTKKT